ncbi:MAG: SpoIVB peptidase [Clostridia bacterium]|nr:SpoIVB peptidase [Clostridia bacterium]
MKYKNRWIRAAGVLFALLLCFSSPVGTAAQEVKETKAEQVILGGMPFGVSFQTGELKISGFDEIETDEGTCSPARDAGLLENDIIKKVDGKAVKSALDVTVAVKSGKGREIGFDIVRGEEKLCVRVKPCVSKESGEYRLGLWLEDGTAGLGTVTYIEKKTGEFGGLGHGIVKADTGELSQLSRGVVSEVVITGVEKGKVGDPGELKGDFMPAKLGVVTKNTEVGVFGVITEMPEGTANKEIEVAAPGQVKDGGASVFCTVDGGGICEYAVEITCLENCDEGAKNFLISVTDTSLIEKTGGIVRGMSGSPVVQDGKLIGAVTHVLVNDPTRGYGIYIENMLEAK